MSGITDTIDSALDDWRLSPDAMRWTPDAEQVAATMPTMPMMPTLDFDLDIRPFQEAMRRMAEQVVKSVAKLTTVMAPILERIAHRLPDHNKVRCRRCSPMANPPVLSIDGHEYARRRKGRKR